jgi:hypothetical protein
MPCPPKNNPEIRSEKSTVFMRKTIPALLAAFLFTGKVALAQADTIAPEAQLIGDSIACVYVGEKYTDNGLTVEDNIDSMKDITIVIEGSFLGSTTDKPGCHVIRYKVIDKSGNIGYTGWRYIVVRPTTDLSPCDYSEDSCKRWAAAGIEDKKFWTIQARAYPNPARDYIMVDVSNAKAESYTISLLDISGRCITREVRQETSLNNEIRISTAGIRPGTYFISIETPVAKRILPISLVK